MSEGITTNIGSNIAGIGSLLNSMKLNNEVSLDDAERKIMREFSDVKFEDESDDVELEESSNDNDPIKSFEETLARIDDSDAESDNDESNVSDSDDEDQDVESDNESIRSQAKSLVSRHQSQYPMSERYIVKAQSNRVPYETSIVPKLNIDIERDAEDDKKNQLLEQIDSLRDDLDELGVSTDRIHHVTFDSSLRQVEDVHKRLMFKYNKLKYNSIAEEAIVAGAGLLEMIFNGKQTYFGCKPDITGYSDVVKSKLKRIRYETSSAVNRFVTSNNVGGMSMIAMELLPSLITQSQRRRLQAGDTINASIINNTSNNRETIRSHISDLNSML